MALGIPALSICEVFTGGLLTASLWAISISGVTIFANFALAGRIRILPSALLGLVIGAVAYEIGHQYFGYRDATLIGYIGFIHLFKTRMFFEGNLTWASILKDTDIPLLTAFLISLFTSFDTILSVTAIDEMKGTDSNTNYDLRVHGIFNAVM
jgi:MFS superfamily sulfate permease-like transporter